MWCPKPFAPSVYVHVPEAPSPHERSISVMSHFPSSLSRWPVNRPRNWKTLVDGGLSNEELQGVRDCVGRVPPWGPAPWVVATAARLKLHFTLRGPGRPGKTRQSVMSPFPSGSSSAGARPSTLRTRTSSQSTSPQAVGQQSQDCEAQQHKARWLGNGTGEDGAGNRRVVRRTL